MIEIAYGQVSAVIEVQVVDAQGQVVNNLDASTMPQLIISRGLLASVSSTFVNLSLATSPWVEWGLKFKANGVYRVDVPNSIGATRFSGSISGEAGGNSILGSQLIVTDKILPNGPYRLSVTVTDDDDDLMVGVDVTVYDGVIPYYGITNASGVSDIGVGAGSFLVVLRKAGYSYTPTTHVVSGDSATHTLLAQMTARVVAPPDDPDYTTGTLYTEDAITTVSFRLTDLPEDDEGHQYNEEPFDATSAAHELEVDLLRGATYVAIATDGKETQFVVPADAGDSFSITSLIGLFS